VGFTLLAVPTATYEAATAAFASSLHPGAVPQAAQASAEDRAAGESGRDVSERHDGEHRRPGCRVRSAHDPAERLHEQVHDEEGKTGRNRRAPMTLSCNLVRFRPTPA